MINKFLKVNFICRIFQNLFKFFYRNNSFLRTYCLSLVRMICENCQTSIYIIDDYGGGCTLCTNCGLVASSFLCLDESVYDKASEKMSHSLTNELDTQFQLQTSKFKTQSNVSFFASQDPHTLKLMIFNKKFEQIFQATQLHDLIGTESKLLYLEFEKKYSFKGRNIDFVICAFIFIAAKKNNYAINMFKKYWGSVAYKVKHVNKI